MFVEIVNQSKVILPIRMQLTSIQKKQGQNVQVLIVPVI
jgi:hypothetical protein